MGNAEEDKISPYPGTPLSATVQSDSQSDVEKHAAAEGAPALKRKLKARHLQMIAIGM